MKVCEKIISRSSERGREREKHNGQNRTEFCPGLDWMKSSHFILLKHGNLVNADDIARKFDIAMVYTLRVRAQASVNRLDLRRE